MDFIYRLGGTGPGRERVTMSFRNAEGRFELTGTAPRVHERVRPEETIFADGFVFLRDEPAARRA
ncbi:hypothetical protein [Thermomonospora sp. CIF 1]|uniref:hypothetical protein n=1 Tax=Thermomonospora sp. CIF 1 TaxID=1916083 RepID=UPI00257A3B88|nr:hypothetical protein [Thermomonospora sp. CIF 1]